MADFCFFTDFESFLSQDVSDRFGPISDSQYRVDSLFNVTTSAKAYAPCAATIMVQITASGGMNFILKPKDQPKLNIGKIEYIIYRGLQKSKTINGSDVAARINNDLNEKIWSNQEETDANNDTGPNTPNIAALGVAYSNTGVGAFEVLDTDLIESVFFKVDDVQLVEVKAGDYIGDFKGGAEKASIEFVVERLGESSEMALARKDEHIITITSVLGATQAENFFHYNEKEQILGYIDPAAFYSMFRYGEDNLTINSTLDDTYNILDLVQKFKNKNRIYLDIRNEQDYSYNYYKNYGENIKISLDADTPPDPLPEKNFYTENLSGTSYGRWPIFFIEGQTAVDITTDNEHGKLLIQLSDTNQVLKACYLTEVRNNGSKTGTFHFVEDNSTLFEISSWVYDNDGSFDFGCAYILMKTVFDRESNYEGLFAPGSNSISHVFPINKLKVSFDMEPNDVIMKVYQDAGIIQHYTYPEHFGETYAAFVGLAKDSHSCTFFTHPNENIGFLRNAGRKPNFTFISSRHGGKKDFFWLLHSLSGNVAFQLREVTLNDEPLNTIQYLDDTQSSLDVNISPNHINTIQLTHDEYDDILVLIESSNFELDYNVYLSVNPLNTKLRDIPGYVLQYSQLTLEGLEFKPDTGDSVLQKLSVNTGIFIQSLIAKD